MKKLTTVGGLKVAKFRQNDKILTVLPLILSRMFQRLPVVSTGTHTVRLPFCFSTILTCAWLISGLCLGLTEKFVKEVQSFLS